MKRYLFGVLVCLLVFSIGPTASTTPSTCSYIGTNDPGLLITSVNLGTLRTGWNGFHGITKGYAGFGFWTTPITHVYLRRVG